MAEMSENGAMLEQNEPPQREAETDVIREARRHFSKLGLMFFLGTIIIYIVQLIPMGLIQWLRPEWMENGDLALMVSILPMYLIGMPMLILLVRRLPGERPERHSMHAGHFILAAIICFALVYVTNFLGNMITIFIGILKGSAVQNQILNVTSSVSMWVIVLYMVICAPIMEEYIFRKLIVDRTARYGQAVAVLTSGLMFGLFHGNLNQFVYAFVLGVFLAFLYVKTGNIKITIGLHMMINFMGGAVSSWLMRQIDLDEYLQLVEANNGEAIAGYIQDNLLALLIYLVFVFFVIGITLAGIVLLIVFLVKGRFTFEKGRVVIPRGKRFFTVILNAGMIVYSIFWIAMIIIQLFL